MSHSLRQLVRCLAATPAERCTLAAALVLLIRGRRRLLTLSPLLAVAPSIGTAKLRLWRAIAASLVGRRCVTTLTATQIADLQWALQATQAHADALARRQASCVSPYGRGLDYPALLAQWRRKPPERLLIFHHHDRRGLLPATWLNALIAIRRAGWDVLVSSSALEANQQRQLEHHGAGVALRRNLGLCLGAYKDLSLLLLQDSTVASSLRSLVLCNDSTLPVAEEEALVSRLQSWVDALEDDATPVLAGLTDSAQRGCYHLQSYFLYANAALLRNPAWQRFWLGFSLCGSKDELINNGEIGLSQAVLRAGGRLRPAYPLIEGLLENQSMASELQSYRIWQPKHVNPTLFAWQSLLAQGFPLVKKHLLFELAENEGQPMALTALSSWLPPARRARIASDLQELFISRYAFTEPDAP